MFTCVPQAGQNGSGAFTLAASDKVRPRLVSSEICEVLALKESVPNSYVSYLTEDQAGKEDHKIIGIYFSERQDSTVSGG